MIGDDVELQLLIWGYAIGGEVTNAEALLVETRPGDDWLASRWDRRLADLAMTTIRVGGRVRTPPAWFCLRWLPDSIIEAGIAELHAAAASRAGRTTFL